MGPGPQFFGLQPFFYTTHKKLETATDISYLKKDV